MSQLRIEQKKRNRNKKLKSQDKGECPIKLCDKQKKGNRLVHRNTSVIEKKIGSYFRRPNNDASIISTRELELPGEIEQEVLVHLNSRSWRSGLIVFCRDYKQADISNVLKD